MNWIIVASIALLVFSAVLAIFFKKHWLVIGELDPSKYNSPLLSIYKREHRGVHHPALLSGRIGRRWYWFLMRPWWEPQQKRRVRQRRERMEVL